MQRLLVLIVLFFLAITCSSPISSQQRQTMDKYEYGELMDYVKGTVLTQEQTGNLWDIYRQLVDYSGMQFTYVLGQTYQWGQAHVGGVIVLDRSSAVKPKDILAFMMAHEWGHEALGHEPNLYHPYGQPWGFRALGRSEEDAADAYAGQFLAKRDYDVCAVTRFLKSTPKSPTGDTHSDGPERAENIAEAAGVDLDSCETHEGKRVTFSVEITPIQLGALGAEVSIWIDEVSVGMISNMGDTSIETKRFVKGRHTWRLAARVYAFDRQGRPVLAQTLQGSGSMSVDDGDTFLVKGYTTNLSLEKE